jgi:peptide/nickel transport system substrate-binding protein
LIGFQHVQCTTRMKQVSQIICAALLFALSACSNQSGSDLPDNERLVVAMSTLSETTFLPWNGSTGRKLYLDPIYDYLVYLDPENDDLVPGLAQSWEMSDGGRTHTLMLRPGIQFQQGWGEVTAEDVKYTIDRIIAPDALVGPSSILRRVIREVRAPEKYKVEIELAVPDIEFVRAYLANSQSLMIVSKAYFDAVGDEQANDLPIGSGAYAMYNYIQDVSITYRLREDRENLWRTSPDFSELHFIASPEEFTRVAMLMTGEADLAPVNFDSINVLEQSGLQVKYVPLNWTPVVRLGGLTERFYNGEVPWQNEQVRLALNYAIDKQTIIDSIFHGHGVVTGADNSSGVLLDLEGFSYDPERARALLVEAGYPNGFPIRLKTFTTSPGAELPIVAQAVALYWEAVGIDVTIEPTNWVGHRSAWTTGNATDLAWTHRGFPFSTPLAGLSPSNYTDSLFATFANETTDDYLNRIGSTQDIDERADLVMEFAVYLRDVASTVFIGHIDEPYGASSKVGDWPTINEQTTNLDLIRRASHE